MPNLPKIGWADQVVSLSPKPKRKPTPQDMERKKLKMGEYYKENREKLLAKAKARSKAAYRRKKYQAELLQRIDQSND